MLRYLFYSLSVLLLLLLLQNCAQMSPLTGGAKDIQPPKLISALPPLSSTGFTNTSISLRFDEYIQLKDLSANLVVLPRLKTMPDVEVNGKTLTVKLDTSELEPNTTYRLYFGQSIADMNEGNALRNFEYVFSTGGFIDSLQIHGQVRQASNLQPADNILIGLYEESLSNDSSVFKEAPHYITKTNTSGKFRMAHLPAKSFKAYAVEDKNKNLSLDPDVEKVGFLNQTVQLPADSILNFTLFKEVPAKHFLKKTISPYYGLTMLVFNKTPKVILRSYYPAQEHDLYTETRTHSDTLMLFYKNAEDSLKLLIDYPDEGRTDTLLVNLAKKSQKRKKFGYMRLNTTANTLKLNTALTLNFITWMDTTFFSASKLKFRYQSDSAWMEQPVKAHWLSVHELRLAEALPEGRSFELKLDTSAFHDAFSNTNDSALFLFKTQSRSELGKAVLKMQFLKKEPYLVQLLNERETVIQERSLFLSLSSSNSQTIEFTELPAGVYKIRVVFDTNNNQKWDGGSLLKGKQAESVFMHSKSIKVLADWEIEEEIRVNEENGK